MTTTKKLLGGLLLLQAGTGFARSTEGWLSTLGGSVRTHYAIFEPQSAPLADVLYLHGFADRFENHRPLFNAYLRAGARVLAIDLPSHGLTHGTDINDLSFAQLAQMVAEFEARFSADRPLIVNGWSTGGLLAVRITQSHRLSRPIAGLLLHAPAVAVPPCVGELCFVTNPTLTHDELLWPRPIHPLSPLMKPLFATALLKESIEAWRHALPSQMPVRVFVGGDTDDRYVVTPKVKEWVAKQREFGVDVALTQMGGARHELDNELPEFGGPRVRERSAAFLRAIAQ